MKSLKRHVVNFVKQQMVDAKRGIDVIKAKREVSVFHILEKHIGTFHNYQLYRDDLAVLAYSGAYSYEPNAIFVDEKIIINSAFESLPSEYQEAILLHELAHIVLKHRPNRILYPIQASVGFGYGLQIEYEADEFSTMKGAKMLETLEYLQELQAEYDSRSVRLRIKRLRKLNNVSS